MTRDDQPPHSARALAEQLARRESLSEQIAKSIRSHGMFDSERVLSVPPLSLPRIPSPSEQNAFQSAGILVKRMAQTVAQWRAQVATDCQPVVLALLQGGVQINVTLLAEESFHVLRIEGTIDGSPCMLLTHQASVQLLCFVAKVEQESQRRRIGFIIDGKESTE